MSHYDTLEVERTASAEDIKAAFRRLASQHHPDKKDGDPAKMAAVNRAYECLGDPDRRAAYDENGHDLPVKPVEIEAANLLMQFFNGVLGEDEDDIVGTVHKALEHHRTELTQVQTQRLALRERIAKKTGKVRVKDGQNLAQMMIDQRLRELDAGLQLLQRGLIVNKTACAMLTAYEQDPSEAPVFATLSFGFSPFQNTARFTRATP